VHRRHDIPLDFLDVARQIACHGNSKDLWTMYALKTPAGPEKTPAGPEKTPAGPEKNARACPHAATRLYFYVTTGGASSLCGARPCRRSRFWISDLTKIVRRRSDESIHRRKAQSASCPRGGRPDREVREWAKGKRVDTFSLKAQETVGLEDIENLPSACVRRSRRRGRRSSSHS